MVVRANKRWSMGATFVLAVGGALGGGCQKDDSASQDPSGGGAGGESGVGDGDGDGDGDSSGPDIPSGLTPVSGSRLKQVWLEGGGAARAERILDSELGVECRFEVMEDGSTRCAPLNSEAVVFLDSDCSQALLPDYEGDCGQTPSEYSGVYLPSEGCGPAVFRLFHATESVDTPDTIYRLEQGECVAEDANPENSYFAAELIPPDELVEVKRVVDERTSALGVSFYATADGGYFYDGPVNLEQGQGCDINELFGGGREPWFACVVSPAFTFDGNSYGFADEGCSEGVAWAPDSCVEPEVVFSTDTDDDGCLVRELRQLGDELSSIYDNQEGACEAVSEAEWSPAGRRFEVGEPASGLLELDLEVGQTDGALARRHYVYEGETIGSLHELWHVEKQTVCRHVLVGDGEWVCLPGRFVSLGSSIESGTFADQECTVEVVFGGNPGACPDPEEFSYIVEQSNDICDQTGTIYEAGETFVTNTIYLQGEGTCEAQVDATEGYWVEVGAPVDVKADLISLSERVDD